MGNSFLVGVCFKFQGQLGIKNGKNNIETFQEIPSLMDRQVLQVEAHLAQSACLLGFKAVSLCTKCIR